jgi:hypothetical protein
MTRTPKATLSLAALLVASCIGSLAFASSTSTAPSSGSSDAPAMADIFVEEELGMRVRIFDDKGNQVESTHYHFGDQFGGLTEYIVPQGKYTVEVVFYKPRQLDAAFMTPAEPALLKTTEVTFGGGASDIEVDETGAAHVVQQPLVEPPKFLEGVGVSSFALSGGAQWVKSHSPSVGVLPTTDAPALTGPSHITAYGVDLGVNLWSTAVKRLLDACWWDFGMAWGDESKSGQVPAGMQGGYAFWQLPSNGVTGVSSALGWNVQTKTKYQDAQLDWLPPHWFQKYENWYVQGRPKFGLDHFEFKYDGSISNAIVPGVSSTTDQKLKVTDFSVGYSLWGMYPLPNHGSAKIGIGIDAIYYDGRFNGMQSNMCTVCSSNNLFDVTASDSKSGLTVGGWVNPVLRFMAGPNAQIFVEGMYRYLQKSPFVTSKVTPPDAPPHLETGSHDLVKVSVGVQMKF